MSVEISVATTATLLCLTPSWMIYFPSCWFGLVRFVYVWLCLAELKFAKTIKNAKAGKNA